MAAFFASVTMTSRSLRPPSPRSTAAAAAIIRRALSSSSAGASSSSSSSPFPAAPPAASSTPRPPPAPHPSKKSKSFASAVYDFVRPPVETESSFDHRSWSHHRGPFRNARVWSPSSVFRSVAIRRIMFPDVATAGFSAGVVTYYNLGVAERVWEALDTDKDGRVSTAELRRGIRDGLIEAHHVMGTDFFTTPEMLTTHTQPFTITALAIGLLLTFRTQNCNARYAEARILWGAMTNESRALSSRLLSFASNVNKNKNNGAEAKAKEAVARCAKLIMTFPIALKYHLTLNGQNPNPELRGSSSSSTSTTSIPIHDIHDYDDDSDEASIETAKRKSIREELSGVWDCDDEAERSYVRRLASPDVANRPLHVLHELGDVVARKFGSRESSLGLDPIHVSDVHRSLSRFHDVLGSCERIFKTPIYTEYTKFSCRCVWLWTNTLPLALYPIMGPYGTVPTSMIVALFMYGLEDIGSRIEQPFEVLPLWQYCQGIESLVKQIMNQDEGKI